MRTVLALAATAVCLLAGCSSPPTAVRPAGELVPDADRRVGPELAGELMDGSTYDASSTEGRVTVVNFWGSWCSPCRVEVPELQEMAEANRGAGLAVVGVNVKDNPAGARQFLADNEIGYPSLDDRGGRIAVSWNDFSVSRTPSTVLVDRSGQVAAVYLGAIGTEDLQRAVDRLLAEG